MIYHSNPQFSQSQAMIARTLDEVRSNLSDHLCYRDFAKLASCSKNFIGLAELREWMNHQDASSIAQAMIHLMTSDMAEADFLQMLDYALRLLDFQGQTELKDQLLVGSVKANHSFYLLQLLSDRDDWTYDVIAASFKAACEFRSSEAMDILLEHPLTGAVSVERAHRTIHQYIEEGQEDVVRMLVYRIKSAWNLGQALTTAVQSESLDMVSLLLTAGANINHIHGLPLKKACRTGNHRLVQHLLAYQPDLNAREGEALAEAIWGRHTSIVTLLVNRGANVTLHNVQTALARKGNAKIKELIKPRSWVARRRV